jgi:hypothetical protein
MEFESALADAGLVEVEIRDTHRVHEFAAAAIVRAVKPPASACCSATALASCCAPAEKAGCCGEATESAGCGCSAK